MKRIHLTHFFVLFALLGSGIGTFFYVQPNVVLQLLVGITTSVAYVVWGLVHHAIQNDLHQKVVVEYMLIGAIAIVLLVTILGF